MSMTKDAKKVLNEYVGKMEMRGCQVWLCTGTVELGLTWRPIADFSSIREFVRDQWISSSRRGTDGN